MSLPVSVTKLPLILHLLIETPASLSFLLKPHSQLPGASPEAVLILRNFGGLLLSTNILTLLFLYRGTGKEEDDGLTALVEICLGTYHFWPIHRAWRRMNGSRLSSAKREERKERENTNGKGNGYNGWSQNGNGKRMEKKEEKAPLGGPKVHFVVHVVCLVALLGVGISSL
ncbi:hypothetical protein QBC35DRAFT_493543 [Podospora australis]|uniref:Uncharacterized protein n=1 Tax=Podospora australis TaxID=1536484 RepID=A0AAN6WXK3_9PEZI|nr:hypothetical protein QBC35DRAFT_493543 [Podospora australis]